MPSQVRRSHKNCRETDNGPVIVVLTHKRVAHLRKTLQAILSATGFRNHRLVVVIDGGDKSVERLVRTSVASSALLILEDQPALTPAQRMSFALKGGLNLAFNVMKAPYAIVLDDDIVVSRDFLEFMAACHNKFGNDPRFRGVNGFSQVPAAGTKEGSHSEFVKLNYGLGWGWSINRATFFKIYSALDLPHPEGWVWDFAIEPYIRTGFVVNPVRSRVRNIGFDETASHTGGDAGRKLGTRIDSSFLSDAKQLDSDSSGLRLSNQPFQWREDCFNLSNESFVAEIMLYWLQAISKLLYDLGLSSNAHVRHHSRKIRTKLASVILRKYGK